MRYSSFLINLKIDEFFVSSNLDKTEKGTTRETNKNLNEISIKNLRK
jgi:hypothetical protein